MKHKIFIIMLLGTIIASFIYFHVKNSDFNLLALGDGLSTGMTPYHVEGYDFNDYLAEYLNEERKLSDFYKSFNETDETITNLINKINDNMQSVEQKIKIKQAIKKANTITIAIGMDELNNYAYKNNLGSTKINGFIQKYNELLKIIRSLNDKQIFIIGLYSTSKINSSKIEKINNELQQLAQKYHAEFIDITNIIANKEFFLNKSNYYLNYKGQKYIFEIIKEKLETTTVMNII